MSRLLNLQLVLAHHSKDAIRELEAANADKISLEKELENLKSHLQFNAEEKQELQNQLRESLAHAEGLSERFSLLATDLRQTGAELDKIKKERNEALEYCAHVLKGDDITAKLQERIREMIDHHVPHLKS